MDSTRIVLETKQKGQFLSEDGYEGVTIAELSALSECARQTLRSLEAELRKHAVVWKGDFVQRLHKGMETVVTLQHLAPRADRLVPKIIEALQAEAANFNRQSRIYRTFLCDIGRQLGRGFVLLCATCLGRQRIITMSNQQRCDVLKYLKLHTNEFDYTLLDSIAVERDIPEHPGKTYIPLIEYTQLTISSERILQSECENAEVRGQQTPIA